MSGDVARRWSGFDLLRIAAALLVVASHAIYLAGGIEPRPLTWGPDPWPLGSWGVAVFFATSGFLVTRSWDLDPDLGRFARRRVARIWPALLVVVVGMALVIGPFVTTVSVGDYLTDASTWAYVVLNSVLATVYLLPGVFSGNEVALVNGSLWSLPLEAGCYLVVAVLGVLGAVARRGGVLVLATVAVAVAWLLDLGVISVPEDAGTVGHRAPILLALFLLGAAAHVVGVPRSPWLVVASLAFLVLARGLPLSGLGYVALAFLVLRAGTASSSAVDRLHRLGDPSYGTFLWGWPVSQLLVAAGVRSPLSLVLLSVPLALACGYLSWWAVERRVLRRTRDRLAEAATAPPIVAPRSGSSTAT